METKLNKKKHKTMTAHKNEDYRSTDLRITQIEKQLVELQTQARYMDGDINELKVAIKECTDAINTLSSKISAEENHTATVQWFVMAIIAIGSAVVGHFI